MLSFGMSFSSLISPVVWTWDHTIGLWCCRHLSNLAAAAVDNVQPYNTPSKACVIRSLFLEGGKTTVMRLAAPPMGRRITEDIEFTSVLIAMSFELSFVQLAV